MADWRKYMQEMPTLKGKIKDIMQNIPESRNMTHDQFIAELRSNGITNSAESITRARRKVWQDYPDLQPNAFMYVQQKREKEKGIRSWVALD